MIWDQIIVEADKFWPYVCVVEDLELAMREAKKQVQIVEPEVNKRPLETAENAMTYLSSLSDEASSSYSLQTRVVVVSVARKVIAKHRMKETVQPKIELTEHKIQEVIKLSKNLTSKGLPFFWEEMGPLLSQKDY